MKKNHTSVQFSVLTKKFIGLVFFGFFGFLDKGDYLELLYSLLGCSGWNLELRKRRQGTLKCLIDKETGINEQGWKQMPCCRRHARLLTN